MDEQELRSLFSAAPGDAPSPTFSQDDVVRESRRQTVRRRNRITAGVSAAALVVVGFGAYGVLSGGTPQSLTSAQDNAAPAQSGRGSGQPGRGPGTSSSRWGVTELLFFATPAGGRAETGRPASWPKAPPGANRWTGSSPSPSLASSPSPSPFPGLPRAAPVRRRRGPRGSRSRAARWPRRCTRRASRWSSSPSRPARSPRRWPPRPVDRWCWSACLPPERRRRTRARWTRSRTISRPASEPGSARLAE